MSHESSRAAAPTADQIEGRFRHPLTRVSRPVFRGSMRVLSFVRRYSWTPIGLEHLPTDGPVIFASNHDSHSDTAAILDVLPRKVRSKTAVAAALDVFGAGHKGTLAKRVLQFTVGASFHAFAFDRHGPPLRSIKTSKTLISRGWNLLLYPEGTRGKPGKIVRFKAGVALLARYSKRPVVPVYVDGGYAVLPMGATLPRSAKVTVSFGKPMYYERGESPDDFAKRVREAVIELRAEVQRRQAEQNFVREIPESVDETASATTY